MLVIAPTELKYVFLPQLVDEQHRRRALAVELESAKRECVVLEAFAERQQAILNLC